MSKDIIVPRGVENRVAISKCYGFTGTVADKISDGDPIHREKIDREIQGSPSRAQEIGSKCRRRPSL
jgi:hypothetical protein